MRTDRSSLYAVADVVGSSLVSLEVDGRVAAGFAAGGDGMVVCNLHTVVGARAITARLHDGRRVRVRDVAGLDAARDLCVLRLDEVPAGLVALEVVAGVAVPERGDTVLTTNGADSDGPLVATTVLDHQRAGDRFAVFVLGASLPMGAAGAPVLGADGALVGVLTIAKAAQGVVSVGIPAQHLASLLASPRAYGFDVLEASVPRRTMPPREVPEHSLSMLDGASPRAMESVARAVVEAIQEGAPAYNRGDAARCWEVYARAAEALLDAPAATEPVRAALREGLTKARARDDDEARAWAMRDCFDGLLQVIERWVKTRNRGTLPPPENPELPDPFAPRPKRWVN